MGQHETTAGDWPARSYMGRLPERSRNALNALGTRRRIDHSGEVLLHQGDRSTHVMLLRKACVKVTAGTADGRNTLLAIRMSGDVVGELSALDGAPRSATVVTCGPAELSTISPNEFEDFLGRHAVASVELNRMEAERLRWANRRRADFHGFPVGVRLARALVDLAELYGEGRDQGRVDFDVVLTQAELGNLVGAAEVTINKEMAKLRRQGLMDTLYARPVILDLPRLRAVAEITP